MDEEMKEQFGEHAREIFGSIDDDTIQLLFEWVESFPVDLPTYEVIKFLDEGNWLF